MKIVLQKTHMCKKMSFYQGLWETLCKMTGIKAWVYINSEIFRKVGLKGKMLGAVVRSVMLCAKDLCLSVC